LVNGVAVTTLKQGEEGGRAPYQLTSTNYDVAVTQTPEAIAARAVLGVDETATRQDIDAAFKLRASLLHPDAHAHRNQDGQRAATAAMQQLNDARDLLKRHVPKQEGLKNSQPSEAATRGGRWRCPDCSSEFEALDQAETSCPGCGRRLRLRSEPSGPGPGQPSSGHREIVYTLRRWSDPMTAALTARLRDRSIPFAWEGDDLIIGIEHERAVDQLIAAAEADESRGRRSNRPRANPNRGSRYSTRPSR
jgi:curved DNA-binding protein CbpA